MWFCKMTFYLDNKISGHAVSWLEILKNIEKLSEV
jgi:hypothetical protein